MDRNSERGNLILSIFVAIIILFFFISGYTLISSDKNSVNAIMLENGWTLSNGGDIDDSFSKKKGEELIFYKEIPKNSFVVPAILIDNHYSAIETYLEDNIIYYYGIDELNKGENLGGGWHVILLPKDSSGKELKIKYRFNDDYGKITFKSPVFAEAHDIKEFIIKNSGYDLTMGLFLVIMGLCTVLLTVYSLFYSREYKNFIISGLTSFFLGVYIYTSEGLLQLTSDNLVYNNWIEVLSYYFTIIMFIIYVWSIWKPDFKKTINKPFYFLSGISLLLMLISIVLALAGIVPTYVSMNYISIVNVASLVSVLLLVFQFIKEGSSSKYQIIATHAGFSLIILFIVMIVVKYTDYRSAYKDIVSYALLVSSFLFFCFMYISIIMTIIHIGETTEREKYIIKAHRIDFTTNMRNRMNFFSEFEKSYESKKKFVFILIKLRGLKEVNQHLGYMSSIEMLENFSEIIRKSFNKEDVLGRIDEDKFGVILDLSKRSKEEDYLENFNHEIAKQNSSAYLYHFKIYYGISESDEAADYESLYNATLLKLEAMEEEHEGESVIRDMAKLTFDSIKSIIRDL